MKQNIDDPNKQMVLMLGYLCIATEIESSLIRKVKILDKFGLADSDIAQICSSSVQSIRNARQAKGK